MLNQTELNRLFEYREGGLYWKVKTANCVHIGERAGSERDDGYRRVSVKGKRYYEHQVIYTMLKGEIPEGLEIDHIDGKEFGNRIENLRAVTQQENCFNMKKAKGYYWDKKVGKWRARIRINGREKHLGYFDIESDARNAYLEAKKKYHIIEERS